ASAIPWAESASATATVFANLPDDAFDAIEVPPYLVRARIHGTELHIDRWTDPENSLAYDTQVFGGLASVPAPAWHTFEDSYILDGLAPVQYFGQETWTLQAHASASGGYQTYTRNKSVGTGCRMSF